MAFFPDPADTVPLQIVVGHRDEHPAGVARVEPSERQLIVARADEKIEGILRGPLMAHSFTAAASAISYYFLEAGRSLDMLAAAEAL